MRKIFYLLIILFAAFALRLYPTLLSGLPFSTDAWSPTRNAELLMKYAPINLDSEVFDGYNCYWPANSLFGVVFSHTTGLKPINAMAVGVPLTGALAVLIFYALMTRIGRSHELAFSASIVLAAASLHQNSYENWLPPEIVEWNINDVKKLVEKLKTLIHN